MKHTQKSLFLSLSFTTALLLSSMACSENKGQSSLINTNNQQIDALKGSTIGHHKKLGAPVDLTYNSPIIAAPGEQSTITLTFAGLFNADQRMTVRVNSDAELTIVSDLQVREIDLLNEPQLEVNVVSSTLGTGYIHVICEFYGANNQQSMRVFSVPVQTGKESQVKLRKPEKIETDADGNPIIIQQGETDVIRK